MNTEDFLKFIVASVMGLATAAGSVFGIVFQARKTNLEETVGRVEADARAAKDVGNALTLVTENLSRQINTMQASLDAANQKIDKLTLVVEEYSRGLDILTDQIKSLKKTPAYVKKHPNEVA